MELIFLGTSCMVPTKERNHQAIFLVYNGEGILFDCGEGTQRQLRVAEIKPSKIKKIIISHWHGDHCLGLPGLLQTLSATEYEGSLEIFGPAGFAKYFNLMMNAFFFENKIDLKVKEITGGKFCETESYVIKAIPLKHKIPTLGFRFEEKDRRKISLPFIRKKGIPDGPLLGQLQNNKEITWKGERITPKNATYIIKGKVIGIINDTVYCNGCNEVAENADLVISEAAFSDEHEEKAQEFMHLTASTAAKIASQNNAKELILTHISQRYKSSDLLLDEAKAIFTNTKCAYDFMKKRL